MPLLTEGNKYSEPTLQEGQLRVEAMQRWYHAEYKDEEVNIFAENGEFFIPLESEKVLDFFGYLTTKFENLAFIEEVNQDFLAAAHSERNLKKKKKKCPKKEEGRLFVPNSSSVQKRAGLVSRERTLSKRTG